VKKRMAVFYPIFMFLVIIAIALIYLASTKKAVGASFAFYALGAVFLILTGTILQTDGLSIDWVNRVNQGTVDGNTFSVMEYVEITTASDWGLWMVSQALFYLGWVVIIVAFLHAITVVRRSSRED